MLGPGLWGLPVGASGCELAGKWLIAADEERGKGGYLSRSPIYHLGEDSDFRPP
jgi:hypothetical protein